MELLRSSLNPQADTSVLRGAKLQNTGPLICISLQQGNKVRHFYRIFIPDTVPNNMFVNSHTNLYSLHCYTTTWLRTQSAAPGGGGGGWVYSPISAI